MKRLQLAWSWLVDWFERGDLVPLLVLVSAVHYAAVLSGKDYWPVAVAIGLLVDLGHYRTVRAAVRYNGDDWRQRAARIVIAVGMTLLSLNYHQRYYADWWLSAPLPLLIAALAWLQHVDRRSPAKSEAQPRAELAQTVRSLTQTEAQPIIELAQYAHTCGRTFASQQSLAAHIRHCQHEKANGVTHTAR